MHIASRPANTEIKNESGFDETYPEDMSGETNWKRLKTDPEYWERMLTRSAVTAALRAFFVSEGFLEVETPILVRVPGMEPNLQPMTVGKDGKVSGYLITSPEYAMKKLLAGGLERIFEITKAFRGGEPSGGTHNPEFTMIEWYRVRASYTDIMEDTERLVETVARKTTGSSSVMYQGTTIDLSASWQRMSVREAFDRFCDIDLAKAIDDVNWFRGALKEKGVETADDESFDDMFFRIFLRDIEPHLGLEKPVILYDYPASMAALSRIKEDDARFAERFEVYCAGMELCNAFSELNDADEQRARLEKEQKQRRTEGKPVFDIDGQFIEAVGEMPSSAGIAFGVDRLVMLLTDASSIDDVLFFPAKDIFS